MDRGCQWEVYISLRKSGDWLLGVKSLQHSHPMADNPFEYAQHLKKFNTDYEKTQAEAAYLQTSSKYSD